MLVVLGKSFLISMEHSRETPSSTFADNVKGKLVKSDKNIYSDYMDERIPNLSGSPHLPSMVPVEWKALRYQRVMSILKML